MSLTTEQQHKLHRGLGVIVDAAPPGREYDALSPTTLSVVPVRKRGPLVAATAAVLALALFGPLLLRTSPTGNVGSSITAGSLPGGMATAPPMADDGLIQTEPDDTLPTSARAVTGTDLISRIEDGQASVSDDDGATWRPIVSAGLGLLSLTADGRIIVIRNARGSDADLTADGHVLPAPTVRHYDPATDTWTQGELPRPLIAGEQPTARAPDDTECVLSGLQWSLHARSVTGTTPVVVLGEQRLTADGHCDEVTSFAWVSPDGVSWETVDDLGIDGYAAGVVLHNDAYIAYGSDSSWVADVPDRIPMIWTSDNLTQWIPVELDLSVLPVEGRVLVHPQDEHDAAGKVTSEVAATVVTVSYPVARSVRLTSNIADDEDLLGWLMEHRFPTRDEDSAREEMEMLMSSRGIDFPLDDDEVAWLNNVYVDGTISGELEVTTRGDEWMSTYRPDLDD